MWKKNNFCWMGHTFCGGEGLSNFKFLLLNLFSFLFKCVFILNIFHPRGHFLVWGWVIDPIFFLHESYSEGQIRLHQEFHLVLVGWVMKFLGNKANLKSF